MHVLILIALLLALLPLEVPPAQGPTALAAAVGGYLLIAMALAAFCTRLGLRALRRRSSLRGHRRLSMLTQAWLLAGQAGLLLLGYGGWPVLRTVPLLHEAVAFAPFAAALLLVWTLHYPYYRKTRRQIAEQQAAFGDAVRPGWSLREYLGYNLRHYLLFLAVPVALILLATDALELYVRPALPQSRADDILSALTAAVAAGVFLTAPLLIARIWKTEPLPSGPLRDRLEAICRRLNVRYRAILLWRSGGMIANAAVMGLVGPFRYVLLSDALLEHLDDRCIESVFAHEAGHVLCRHIPYLLLFAVASATMCGAAAESLAAVLDSPPWAGLLATLGLLGAAWAAGFGWLSRRFERQSDVIAAWAVAGGDAGGADGRVSPEGAALFAAALQRVALLNGIPGQQFNWRHGSIDRRVGYVLALAAAGAGRADIDRTVRRIKVALWLALALAAAAAILTMNYQG